MKSIKIKNSKKLLIAWICVAVLVASAAMLSILRWSNYKKGQNAAIETALTAIPREFNKKKDRDELRKDMYYYFDRTYYKNAFTSASQAQELNRHMNEINSSFNKALSALGFTEGGKYYLQYGSFFDLFTSNAFSRSFIGITALSTLSLIALIFVAIKTISDINDKSEIVVEENAVAAKTKKGKELQFLLKDVTNVESKGKNGLVIKGNNILYTITGIQNADALKSAIMDGVARSANITTNTVEETDMDTLKKYKDLLDSGIITQEEFDAKKKQVLGL